jgi:hypothetical protein
MTLGTLIFASALVIGILAIFPVKWGNPQNMIIRIRCFLRDISRSIGLHQVWVAHYLRPEVIGFILGSFIAANTPGEFRTKGG